MDLAHHEYTRDDKEWENIARRQHIEWQVQSQDEYTMDGYHTPPLGPELTQRSREGAFSMNQPSPISGQALRTNSSGDVEHAFMPGTIEALGWHVLRTYLETATRKPGERENKYLYLYFSRMAQSAIMIPQDRRVQQHLARMNQDDIDKLINDMMEEANRTNQPETGFQVYRLYPLYVVCVIVCKVAASCTLGV